MPLDSFHIPSTVHLFQRGSSIRATECVGTLANQIVHLLCVLHDGNWPDLSIEIHLDGKKVSMLKDIQHVGGHVLAMTQ